MNASASSSTAASTSTQSSAGMEISNNFSTSDILALYKTLGLSNAEVAVVNKSEDAKLEQDYRKEIILSLYMLGLELLLSFIIIDTRYDGYFDS